VHANNYRKQRKHKTQNITPWRLINNAWWALKLNWATAPGLISGLVVISLVGSLLPAGVALISRSLVNSLVNSIAQKSDVIQAVIPWIIAGMILTILEAGTRALGSYLNRRLLDDMEMRLIKKILEHADQLDLAFFESTSGQDILSRVLNNTARYFLQFVTNTLSVLASLVQGASLVTILIVIEPLAALALFVFAVPYLIHEWRLARDQYSKEYNRTTKNRWRSYFLSRMTQQSWVPEVKQLGLAPLLIEQYQSLVNEMRTENRKLYQRGLLGDLVFSTLATAALYGLLIRVAGGVFSGALTVGDVAIYGGSTARLRSVLQSIIQSIGAVSEGVLYISNLREFFEIETKKDEVKNSNLTQIPQGDLEIAGISFAYPGTQREVLKNISLQIREGEVIALVGENGAGKTTLAKLLARFYEPSGGAIYLDGSNINQFSFTEWNNCVGMIHQNYGIYEATTADNIAYGDWRRLLGNQEEIVRVARQANIHELIESMPNGYNTLLGRTFGEYTPSGGQWQRIALARVFARPNAWLLILDEPTANLDARAEYELFTRFRDLAAGKTTILISHRFSTVSMADRILVMADGEIVEEGSHKDLLALDGHYASLYRLHHRQMAPE